MAVFKYNSIRYSGGIDISNTVDLRASQLAHEISQTIGNTRQNRAERLLNAQRGENDSQKQESEGKIETRPEELSEELRESIRQKTLELDEQMAQLEQQKAELAALREQYIEQGKEVILEAKRRAEGIVKNAEEDGENIIKEAQASRDDVFIKARAEGFEQGRKDGKELLLREGQGALDEVRALCDRMMREKGELFQKYEDEIFETVMQIANKVTLNSMSVKDGTAAKKLIKQAAREFRSAQNLYIKLDDNGASQEIAGDFEFLRSLCGGRIEVELLDHAPVGTITVDDGEEIIDAGIQTQLHMIRELAGGKFADSPEMSHLEETHAAIKARLAAIDTRAEVEEISGNSSDEEPEKPKRRATRRKKTEEVTE